MVMVGSNWTFRLGLGLIASVQIRFRSGIHWKLQVQVGHTHHIAMVRCNLNLVRTSQWTLYTQLPRADCEPSRHPVCSWGLCSFTPLCGPEALAVRVVDRVRVADEADAVAGVSVAPRLQMSCEFVTFRRLDCRAQKKSFCSAADKEGKCLPGTFTFTRRVTCSVPGYCLITSKPRPFAAALAAIKALAHETLTGVENQGNHIIKHTKVPKQGSVRTLAQRRHPWQRNW